MKETAGKAAARSYFYRAFLPSVLSGRELRNSNFLLLLGENFLELELLADIGVPGYRVFSVEREREIYDKQRSKDQQEESGVVLQYAELEEYIRQHLVTSLKFEVFNLDICGTYLRGIDPAMGEILLFARRNPLSVVATYTSAGRDRHQLQEGLKSLAFFSWLSPQATYNLVEVLYQQYMASDLGVRDRNRSAVCKNMVLRHLFWLRSHLEHIAMGSYLLGQTPAAALQRLTSVQDQIWHTMLEQGRFPMKYGQIRKLASRSANRNLPAIAMDLGFKEIQALTYSAHNGFYQMCFFATYEVQKQPLDALGWYELAVQAVLESPVLTINAQGEISRNPYGQIEPRSPVETIDLWDKPDLQADLRRLSVPPIAPLVSAHQAEPEVPVEEAEAKSANGRLDEATVAQIRRKAAAGLRTADILAELNIDPACKGSVAAYVAVSRRRG
jgi:hypothetical protein